MEITPPVRQAPQTAANASVPEPERADTAARPAPTRPLLSGQETEFAPPELVSPAITPRGARPLFMSYRREDTAHAAGRLHERLADAFGRDRVFMDIDAVPLGVDFVEHISEQIVGCSAVIVMIGRQWLTVTDRKGLARLFTESDFVRTEVSAALRLNVPVIPVLVDDADMPTPEELPDDLRPLSRRNGIELSATRWRTDVERLIKELDWVMKPSSGS